MSFVRASIWALLVAATACEAKESEEVGMFNRKPERVSLEDQLAEFAKLGITRNQGVTDVDLFGFDEREQMEAKPFRVLAEAMGHEIEREPWTPISDRLWMCEVERIEGSGSYQSVVERLEQMTGGALALSDIRDQVVRFEEGQENEAWVSFTYSGKTVKWEMTVDDDWLDGSVLTRYDQLLRDAGSSVRLFAVPGAPYGQVEFLGAFTEKQKRRFSKLTGIAMEPVR